MSRIQLGKKPDEVALMRHVLSPEYEALSHVKIGEHTLRAWADRVGMAPKRLYRVLSKWEDSDWWDSGVSTETGWLTSKGREAIRSYLSAVDGSIT